MKTHIKNRFFILVIALFPLWGSGGLGISSCSKNDDNNPQNPVDQLPPATQTGENTIGCLVNGEALLPKGISPSGNRQCFYQLVDGEYHFGLDFSHKKDNIRKSLQVFFNRIELSSGATYNLNIDRINYPEFTDISGGGGYYRYSPSLFEDGEEYTTNEVVKGELKITKLDSENAIVSGTFWFDAKEVNTGEIIHITKGRFDMHYVQ